MDPPVLYDFSEASISDAALLSKYRALRTRLAQPGRVRSVFVPEALTHPCAPPSPGMSGPDKVSACLAGGPFPAETERRDALDLCVLMAWK